MKLHIKRSISIQHYVFYVISYYIEFSPEELEIIKKYHLEEHPMAYGADGKPFLRLKYYLGFTKDKPGYWRDEDVVKVLNTESGIRDSCKDIKALLNAVSSFAGEGTVEF